MYIYVKLSWYESSTYANGRVVFNPFCVIYIWALLSLKIQQKRRSNLNILNILKNKILKYFSHRQAFTQALYIYLIYIYFIYFFFRCVQICR